MKNFIVLMVCLAALQSFGQNSDTMPQIAKVIVHKDPRLDILGEKEAEINTLFNKILARTAMGYRLQVLSTNDRELAMRTKSQLLQKFPEQKVYMIFQLPYLKLRFGNFKTKQEAETYKNQISRMLGGASIYYISERIEVKPEKESKEEDTN
jgi:hypothetical protein